MTYANPNQWRLTAGTNKEAPIDTAERYAASAHVAGQRLVRKVRGPVDELLGHVVAEALMPDVDNLHESAGEAFYHFRAALVERQEVLNARVVDHRATQDELAKALHLLRVGAQETAARFAKARKSPPEWVGQALGITRGPQAQSDEEPF